MGFDTFESVLNIEGLVSLQSSGLTKIKAIKVKQKRKLKSTTQNPKRLFTVQLLRLTSYSTRRNQLYSCKHIEIPSKPQKDHSCKLGY